MQRVQIRYSKGKQGVEINNRFLGGGKHRWKKAVRKGFLPKKWACAIQAAHSFPRTQFLTRANDGTEKSAAKSVAVVVSRSIAPYVEKGKCVEGSPSAEGSWDHSVRRGEIFVDQWYPRHVDLPSSTRTIVDAYKHAKKVVLDIWQRKPGIDLIHRPGHCRGPGRCHFCGASLLKACGEPALCQSSTLKGATAPALTENGRSTNIHTAPSTSRRTKCEIKE